MSTVPPQELLNRSESRTNGGRSWRFFPTRGAAVSFIFFASIAFLVGAALTLFGFDESGKRQVVFLTIGLGILATSLPTVADQLINRRETNHLTEEQNQRLLLEVIRLRAEASTETKQARLTGLATQKQRQVGLVGVYLNESDPDAREEVKQIVEMSINLHVVMNYSHNWIDSHAQALRRRMQDSAKTTTFVLLDPNTDAVKEQARKQGRDPGRLIDSLYDAIRRLKELSDGSVSLSILGHRTFHVQQVILGDDTAAVCSYFNAEEKQESSVFIYASGGESCMFARLKEDTERIVRTECADLDEWFADELSRRPVL